MKTLRNIWGRAFGLLLIFLLPVWAARGSSVTIPLGSTSNHLAWDYWGGGQFHNGLIYSSIPLGHINTMPTGVRAFIKFDISAMAGKTLHDATLTLPRNTVFAVGTPAIHQVSVKLVDYDAGAGAFTNSPTLISRSVSVPGAVSISNESAWFSINVTEAVQTAINRGYSYVTLMLNDTSAEAGGIAPSYVFLSADPSLSVTEAEPVSVGNVATHVAWDYMAGGQFHNGAWNGILPVGNINTMPTRVRTFLKFDVSQYAGRTLSGATLTLSRATGYPMTGSHSIGVDLVDYDAGGAVFANTPQLVARSVTAGTTVNVSNAAASYPVNITGLIQTAIDRGYDYATIRLNDNTVEAGATAPSYVFFATNPSLAVAEPPMTLVENGVSRVSIHNVYPGTPHIAEIHAATQLQTAIARATGVTPAINPSTPAAIKINIGLASQFPSGVGSADEQAYTYRRSGPNEIELVANTSAGVLWAVDDFCRDVLDVVWPLADGQVTRVGSVQSTLKVSPLSKVSWPDLPRRGWIIADNTDGYHYNDLICDWMAHTRQNLIYNPANQLHSAQIKKLKNGIEPDTSTHSFWWMVPADTYFATHPEYFPLIGGVRTRPAVGDYSSHYVQLCVSNPNVLQLVVDAALAKFAAYPEMQVFGVCQNDGNGGWCQCANCVAWDGAQAGSGVYSNRLIHFANLVAQAVAPYYPGKKIGTFAYGETIEPPTINAHPNINVTFTTGGRNYMRKLTDTTDPRNAEVMGNLTGWLAKADHVQFWEYYYYSGLERCAMPWARTLAAELPELQALGVTGMCSEAYLKFWKGMSLFSYAFSRLTWDTGITYDQILEDFCVERYGSAAGVMEDFHRLYEDTIYAQVPVMPMMAPGEQLLPAAFTNTQITTLNGYLTNAESIANVSGTAYHRGELAKERALFNSFLKLREDPTTIPGIGLNRLANPGAESGSASWGTNTQFGNYSYDTPTGGAHTGTKSFRIQCTGNAGWSRWYQNVSGFVPGEKYAIQAWVKADPGSYGEIWMITGGVHIRLAFMETNGQWARIVCPEFTVPASSPGTGIFYMNCHGTGNAYFDDMFLAKLPN